MCMFSTKNGIATPWLLAHYGAFATRGPGLIFIEATAVVPNGRFSPEDLGLWNDTQATELKKIVDLLHSQGELVGIQLSHAGRKSSAVAQFLNLFEISTEEAGGWPDNVKAPSSIPYMDSYYTPKELTTEEIKSLVQAYVDSCKRAIDIGIDVIEVHAGHGYLLSQFLSPVSNTRTDEYGGSFENRSRIVVDILREIKKVIPLTMPIFIRINATDYLEYDRVTYPESWSLPEAKRLSKLLSDMNLVDLIDVSSGANHIEQKHAAGVLGFHSEFSKEIKKEVGDKTLVSTVGKVIGANFANDILEKTGIDLIFVGRQFLKNPGLVWEWAEELGIKVYQSQQYIAAIARK